MTDRPMTPPTWTPPFRNDGEFVLDAEGVTVAKAFGPNMADDRAKAIADALNEQVAWRREVSAIMPEDFKDWHQNNPIEWAALTASVITILRERLEKTENEYMAGLGEIDALKDENARMRALIGLSADQWGKAV